MSEFGHFTPVDVVPDPFAIDEQTWDDDDVEDPFTAPALVFWEDQDEPDPFPTDGLAWSDELVLPDPFVVPTPVGWEEIP